MNTCRTIWIFVTFWLFYEAFEIVVFAERLRVQVVYPYIKSPNIKIFSYVKECRSRYLLNAPTKITANHNFLRVKRAIY